MSVDLSPFAEDGVRDHPASLEVRVPLINAASPRWNYVTAIVVGAWPWLDGPMPTDDEIRMVGSFHQEYLDHWYRQSGRWWKEMSTRPFDLDGGAVGRFLTKYDHGGWGYRRSTWEIGPLFQPSSGAKPEPLEAVLDRVHWSVEGRPSKRWQEWKAAHPNVFPAVAGVSGEDR